MVALDRPVEDRVVVRVQQAEIGDMGCLQAGRPQAFGDLG